MPRLQSRRIVRRAVLTGVLAAVLAGQAAAGVWAESVGERWVASAGQAFNDGWKPLGTAATYLPCQTVRWSFDRSGEDPDRNTMIDDIRIGLAELQRRSGVTFVEVAAGAPSDLTFRWADLVAEGRGPNVSGYGGFSGPGVGFVTLSNRQDWTLNKWSGWEWRRLEWPRPDLGAGWYSWAEGPGRVALVIHETMHAMGFGHVADFTSIMYPQGGIPNNQGQLSPGDIAGLRAMYLDRPCTASPGTSGSTATAPAAPTAGSDDEARPSSAIRLTRTWAGTDVTRQRVRDGRMSATVTTRLAPGQGYRVVVWDWDPQAEVWSKVVRSGRIGPRGTASFTVPITKYDAIEFYDTRWRKLARWTST